MRDLHKTRKHKLTLNERRAKRSHVQVVGQRSGNCPVVVLAVVRALLGQLSQDLLCGNSHLAQRLSDGGHLLQGDSVIRADGPAITQNTKRPFAMTRNSPVRYSSRQSAPGHRPRMIMRL